MVESMCDSVDFDKAIHLTGYGKFHYETLTACAVCIISVGFQNGLAAYIFPAAQCELHLSSFQLSLLNVCFLVGGILSSFLWGTLADFKGRRRILVFAHLLNASATIICMISNSVFTVIACRFLNGFLIGAPGSIIFQYLAEFQPPKYRSSVICYSGTFFTSAWLLLPLLAWLILPINISLTLGDYFVLTSWRLFMIVLVLPEILVGFWFLRLPESPKFVLAKGDSRKALVILQKMFSANTGKHPKEFPVKSLLRGLRNETRSNSHFQCRDKTVKSGQEMYRQFKSLFRPPLMAFTMLVTGIMFTNMFGVFGLGWWLPELFVRFERFHEEHPNKTVTVKELAILTEVKNNCKPSFDAAVIESTIIMGVTSLVGNVLSGYLAGKIRLKIILCATMFMGGLSAISIYWLNAAWQNLAVACIFQSAMVTANMTVGGVVVELFPTSVGAMAICLTMCAGRIGAMASNIIFGLLMDKHCEIPIFVVAVSVLIGAGLCLLIPHKNSQTRNCGIKMEVAAISFHDTKF